MSATDLGKRLLAEPAEMGMDEVRPCGMIFRVLQQLQLLTNDVGFTISTTSSRP
jgi:hypothetical protein